MRMAGVKICGTVRICQSLCRGRRPHRPLQRITFRIHKNLLPARRFGTRACRFVVPPKVGDSCKSLPPAQNSGLRGPAISARKRLIRALGGRPSRFCCKSLSAKQLSLWGRQETGTASASWRVIIKLSDRLLVFHHHAPVQIAALQPQNQHLRRGQICRARNIG